MERLQVEGATIEYQVQGTGEPVLLIPGGVIADGLGRPLLAEPELASRYQLINCHRRGYAGSTLGTEPLTVPLEAADAAALLRHLGVQAAHVAGHSIGAFIALQLAWDAPNLVHSLALLEPPLAVARGNQEDAPREFLALLNAYRSGDKRAAVEGFSNSVFGPNWQTFVEQAVPGGVEQGVQDVGTFIQDMGAIQKWQFGPKEAAAIQQPVLSVRGVARPNPYMERVREVLHSWFPQTEDYDVPTTHLLQMQDPKGVAHGLAEFFSRHPMPVASITPQGAVRSALA